MSAVVEFINARLVVIGTQLEAYYRAERGVMQAEGAISLRGEQKALREVLAVALPAITTGETENAYSGRDMVSDLKTVEG